MSRMSSGPALRASDADREAVAERLRVAAVDGRIDAEELEERLSEVYKARWVADLNRLVADVSSSKRSRIALNRTAASRSTPSVPRKSRRRCCWCSISRALTRVAGRA